jgi:hypothetical protein
MASRDLMSWVEQAVTEPVGQRVLLLGDFAHHLQGERITRVVRPTPGIPLPGGDRGFDLAVAVDVLQGMDRAAGAALLAALRDLTARRLMVAVPASDITAEDTGTAEVAGEWTRSHMLSYGLEYLGEALHGGQSFTIYGFDIDRYKRTPDWLNARHWANPENWGRYRW